MKTVSTSCSSRGEECDVDLTDEEWDEIKEDYDGHIEDTLAPRHDGRDKGLVQMANEQKWRLVYYVGATTRRV